jgi:hypothetical protein
MENEIKNMSRITSDAREPRNRKKGNGYPPLFGAEGKWISSRKIHYFGEMMAQQMSN